MTLINVADVFMAGRLGSVEIAAVGMSNTIRILVHVFMFSVVTGSMTLVAQAKGARDPQKLSDVTRQSLSLGLLIAAILSISGYFLAEPLLTFLNSGGDPNAVSLGKGYLQILFLGTVFLVGNFVMNSLMQGAGDTLTPLYITAFINLLNILFNYVFMFGPGPFPAYGVSGAAMGTVLTRVIGVIISLIIFYSGRNVIKLLPGTYMPNWKLYKDILTIGLPAGFQSVLHHSNQLFIMRIVTATAASTFGAAALSIGIQVISLSFMPGYAIHIAAVSLVGQSLGSWQTDEARQRGNAAIVLGVMVMTAITIPLFIFAKQLVLLFDPSAHPVVLSAGTAYLRINAIAQPFIAIGMISDGALRGAGDSKPALFATIIGGWFFAIPLAYYFGIIRNFGVVGIWWALVLGSVASTAYIFYRWSNRKWLKVALKQTEVYRNHLKYLPAGAQNTFLKEVRSPLMALKNTTENVDESGVSYTTPNGRVQIAFNQQHYQITEGMNLIPE